jgi:hypothetical protein
LCFSLARCLDNWNAHQFQHGDDILALFFGNVSGSLLLFQSFGKVSDLLGLLFLLSGLLFDFTSSHKLTVFLCWWFAVEHPNRLETVFDE